MVGSVPFLSIVVPIYNIEEYVSECVNSISQQTFSDIEIILVNDGSTDSSGEICDKWARQDERVVVIHQENKGLVRARKAGIELANGNYVTFVDGDDWISSDLYESLVSIINEQKVDIICHGITVQQADGNYYIEKCFVQPGLYKTQKDRERLYKSMFCSEDSFSQNISPSLYSKIYRRNIIKKNIQYVDDRITVGEDAACSYICLLDSSSIFVSTASGYYYRYTPDSMTKRYDEHYYKRINIFSQCVDSIVISKNANKIQKQYDLYKLYLYYRNIKDDLCNTDRFKRFYKEKVVYSKEFQSIFKNVRISKVKDGKYNKIQFFLLKHKKVLVARCFAVIKYCFSRMESKKRGKSG